MKKKPFLTLLFSLVVIASALPYTTNAQTTPPAGTITVTDADKVPCTLNGNKCSRTNQDTTITSCLQTGGGILSVLPGGQPAEKMCVVKDASGTTLWSVASNSIITETCTGTTCTTAPTPPSSAVKCAIGTAAGAATSGQLGGGAGTAADCAKAAASVVNSVLGDVVKTILDPIAVFLLGLATLILGIAGVVFNWTILRTVFQFATYFGNSQGMLIAWGVLRDVGNIALLFGFIFMGVATILNVNSHGHSAASSIPRLILFALLLNFSLLASEVVIDTANAFSSVLATQAGTQCTTSQQTSGDASCANSGIAGKVIGVAGITKIWSLQSIGNYFNNPTNEGITTLGLALFVIITALVLISGTIMLASRAVVLCILIVVSPIGFAAMALPPLKKLGDDWWHRLINQSFFAPVFLLGIFVSLKISDGLTNGSSLADALISSGQATGGGGSAGNMQVVLVFIIVMGFMIASLVMAKKMGAAGADFAIKTAGGLTFGAVGFAGRRTIGLGSMMAANGIAKSEWARNNPGRARFLYSIANKGATSSFDPRSGPISGVAKGAKLDFGKTSVPHGMHQIEEKAIKSRTDFANKLQQTDAEAKKQKELEEEKKTITKKKKKDTNDWNDKKDGFAERIKAAQAENTEAGAKLADSLRKEREQGEEQHKKNLRSMNKRVEEIDESIKEVNVDNAKRIYAKSMEHAGLPKWTLTVDKHANHDAAAKILKDVNKTKNERLFDSIKDGLDKVGGDLSHKADEVKEVMDHNAHEEEAGHDEHSDDHGGDHHS